MFFSDINIHANFRAEPYLAPNLLQEYVRIHVVRHSLYAENIFFSDIKVHANFRAEPYVGPFLPSVTSRTSKSEAPARRDPNLTKQR